MKGNYAEQDRCVRTVCYKRKSCFVILICLFLFGFVFAGMAEGSKFVIPKSVTIIEEEAFYGDKSIEEVVLPEGVLEIGIRAFANSGVKEISLPDTIIHIEEDAFDGTDNLHVFANFGSYAYAWAKDHGYILNASSPSDFMYSSKSDGTCEIVGYKGAATDIIIPQYSPDDQLVTEIASLAFQKNTTLTSVVIPETVESISSYAFTGCSGITKLVLPEEITLYDYAFQNLTGLVELTIPVDVDTRLSTIIGFSAHMSNKINESSLQDCIVVRV